MFCCHISAQHHAQFSTHLDSCLWVFILVVVQDFSSIAPKSVTSAVGYLCHTVYNYSNIYGLLYEPHVKQSLSVTVHSDNTHSVELCTFIMLPLIVPTLVLGAKLKVLL